MTTLPSFSNYYTSTEVNTMTARRWSIAAEVVMRMKAGYRIRIELDRNLARSLKTTTKVLDNCFPEGWYEWDSEADRTYLNLPCALSSDIAILLAS